MQFGRTVDSVSGPLGDLFLVLLEGKCVFVDALDGVLNAKVDGGVMVRDDFQ